MQNGDYAECKAASADTPQPTSAFIDPRAFGLIKPAYSVNEILELLPLGRSSFYEAIKDKRLKVAKFGKRTIVLAPDLVAFLASLLKEAA
jgi:predicted DNA-binding transcriptional regulator AlpA